MTNLVALPLLIPLLTGVVLIFVRSLVAQRWLGALSAMLNVALAGFLVQRVSRDGVLTLAMGDWTPPVGIVFVADMFAALLVLATTIIVFACLLYSFRTIGEGREKHYFHAFVQFLTVGVVGSFLTGDLFNLFVCFEVMLISSYALIVLGGEKRQLRESLKYILINIVSSILFVATMAYLYAVVGTLNMAHISERVAEAGQAGVLNVVAVLLLTVFGLKAGLFLFFWLPGSYASPPAVVTALFGGLLTKVGVYAIVRTFTLMFAFDPAFTHTLLGWLGAATMLLGGVGAIAYRDVPRVLIYNIVVAVGFVCFGVSTGASAALDGAVFYLLHDMVAKALLFLLGGMLVYAAGTEKLQGMGGLIERYPALGWMTFVTGMAIVGVPPLSGFIGKLLVVQGGFTAGLYVQTGIALASSLLVLLSMLKLFMSAFWGEPSPSSANRPLSGALYVPTSLLLALLVLLGLGAEWVNGYVSQAGALLLEPERYIEAVLKE
ncbi:Na+/H+ antiporter subunit D [Paenibacillus sp. TRM 82003]|nr:Na+/H+ antiporter subunit D [Paenibacillus sp. TRM 82003]